MNIKTTNKLDAANGNPTWLQESDLSSQGVTTISKLWLDKSTLKCVKSATYMEISGTSSENDVPCPAEGPHSSTRADDAVELENLGGRTITVPAGEFECTKYSLDDAEYWVAGNVPVPVKIVYSNNTITMELAFYK
ncbi:MAG: hypothetical protein ABIH83_03320 [Candidatus Micrarchaeota archaeon]